jgi:hypothetical protein
MMTIQHHDYDQLKVKPAIWRAMLIYFGYVAIFTTIWIISNVEYMNIGKNAETARKWYATPTLSCSLFLVVVVSLWGWGRVALFDKTTSGPKWTWIAPVFMLFLIILRFATLKTENISSDLWLWTILGGAGVGFGEEMITRGSMLVGLRTKFTEGKVWLFSTLLFSALHIPNAFFGVPITSMLVQLVLTFLLGSLLYITRRLSGTLIIPMLLHGLWDTSYFLNQASASDKSSLDILIYPLALICAIPFVYKNWKAQIS